MAIKSLTLLTYMKIVLSVTTATQFIRKSKNILVQLASSEILLAILAFGNVAPSCLSVAAAASDPGCCAYFDSPFQRHPRYYGLQVTFFISFNLFVLIIAKYCATSDC